MINIFQVFSFIFLLSGCFNTMSTPGNDTLGEKVTTTQQKTDSSEKKIVHWPDERLRVKTQAVDFWAFKGDTLQTLVQEMFEIMYAAKGIGLAAPQIGLEYRIAVIDVKGDRSEQWVLINPEILWMKNKTEHVEGCLSIPGEYDRVPRATQLKLRAWNAQGIPYQIEADGLLAHCIQHEVDHLNGVLYIDKLHSIAIIPRYQSILTALKQEDEATLNKHLIWINRDIQQLLSSTTQKLREKLTSVQQSLQESLKPQHPEFKKTLELNKIFHQILLALRHSPARFTPQNVVNLYNKLLEPCKEDSSLICKKLLEIIQTD